jgi:branched-chain amino acid transport system permease protein
VLGGFLIVLSETFIKAAGYSEFSDVFTFILLVAVLMFKPTGCLV